MIIVAFGCVMMGAITLLTRSYTSCVKFYSYQYYIYAHSNFPALPSPLSFSFKKKNRTMDHGVSHDIFFWWLLYCNHLEKELVMDIKEIWADKGMPPMVATNAMLGIKYQPSE